MIELTGLLEVLKDLEPTVEKGHTHLNKEVLDLIDTEFTIYWKDYYDLSLENLGYDIDSISDRVGYLEDNLCYAELFACQNSTPTSLPSGSTYTKITPFLQVGEEKYCHSDLENNQIVFQRGGLFVINGTFSSYLSANNITLETMAFINGEPLPKFRIIRKFGAQNDISTGSSTCLYRAEEGDILDIRCKHDGGVTINIITSCCNLNVSRIDDGHA